MWLTVWGPNKRQGLGDYQCADFQITVLFPAQYHHLWLGLVSFFLRPVPLINISRVKTFYPLPGSNYILQRCLINPSTFGCTWLPFLAVPSSANSWTFLFWLEMVFSFPCCQLGVLWSDKAKALRPSKLSGFLPRKDSVICTWLGKGDPGSRAPQCHGLQWPREKENWLKQCMGK